MRILRVLLLLAFMFFASGCTTVLQEHKYKEDDPRSAQMWNPTQLTREFSGNDPCESFNRTMFNFNRGMMYYIVRPVAWGYGTIFPVAVIRCLDNMSTNMAFPGRLVSCLCQAEWKMSGIVLARFLTNTTIGLAGLFDPASAWFNMPYVDEDMGQAFAKWGIGPGCVLILPCSAATNVRDQIGSAFDNLLDLKIILPYGSSWLFRINSIVNYYDEYKKGTETLSDPYEMAKIGISALRYAKINNYTVNPLPPDPAERATPAPDLTGIPEERLVRISQWYRPQAAEIDTMRFHMFQMQKNNVSWWIKTSPWNSDFVPKGEVRKVDLKIVKDRFFPYQIWQGKTPESPLVILMPGIGGHYCTPQLQAQAELLNDQGYSVVTISSVYNTSFMESAQHFLPGNTSRDALVLRYVLRRLIEDIKTNTKLRPQFIHLTGYSMGGLHALFIADLERKYPVLNISRYVAVNPPVDLLFGLQKFDLFMDVVKEWNRKDFLRQGADALVKYMYATRRNRGRISKRLPNKNCFFGLSRRQAAMLAGISFRCTLRDILLTAKKNRPDWKTVKTPYDPKKRKALYEEVDQFNGEDYAKKCLLPEYLKNKPDGTLEELNRLAGMYCIIPTLKMAPNIRVLHNVDDPLLSKMDRAFLSNLLGDRITWFDCGGHLGNMFVQEHTDAFLDAFKPVTPSRTVSLPLFRMY